jgi:copper chaperone CopZ
MNFRTTPRSYFISLICLALSSIHPAIGQQDATGATLGQQQGDASPQLPELRGTMPIPVVHEPTLQELDTSKHQDWRRATMNLSGSMCPACLLEVETQLRHKVGVQFAHVTHEPKPNFQTTDKRNIADAVIIYNLRLTNLKKLEKCIKDNKYKASEIIESAQW